jgi:hypothetical protein
MKGNEGFVLLRSLLTMAGILICVAAFYAALAIAVRQNGHLETQLGEELSFRRGKIMERVR